MTKFLNLLMILIVFTVMATACHQPVDITDNTTKTGPVLEAFYLSDAYKLVLSFDSPIAAEQSLNLANDLIVTQVIDTTTTLLTGYSETPVTGRMKIVLDKNSTIVAVELGTALSLLDPVTVKTVSQDSITTIGANELEMIANTVGITNSNFVAQSTSANPESNEVLIVFNKNIDRTSIPETWIVIGEEVYSTNSVATTKNGKLSIQGIGEICGFEIKNTETFSITISVSHIRAIQITFNDLELLPNYSILTFTPASSIKSETGISIATNFHPVCMPN